MPVIGVGCVGIGGISRCVHLPGIERSPDLRLAAVCDIDPEALRWAREHCGVDEAHCFTEPRALAACPEVDAVDISTPNHVHLEAALAAVEAGKPYALEKPITLNGAEADRLARLTREKKVKSMVCFSYRFKAAARYARDLVRRGMLGELYHVDVEYYQSWALPFYDTPLSWRFQKELTGSGALGDLGSHALDLARFVTGRDYRRLLAHTGRFLGERKRPDGGMGAVDVDDFANYFAELEGGGAAAFRITRYAYGRGNYQTMELYGGEGALRYELDHRAPDVDGLSICIGPANAQAHTFTRIPIPKEYEADQMQAFADLLLGRGDGLTADILDGQINQHAVDAVLASAKSGGWVELAAPDGR